MFLFNGKRTIVSTLNPTAERRFYMGMAAAILLLVFLGFFQSFYLRPLFPDNPAASYPKVILHGVVYSLWVVLFAVQVGLVKKGRTDIHRKLGRAAGLLAIAMVVLGVDLTLGAVREGRVDPRFGDKLPLVLPVFDLVLFATFVGLGLLYRNQPQFHKRLMLLAMLNVIGAAIGRLPGATKLGPAMPMLVFISYVAAMAIWDYRSTKKIHKVTLLGGLVSIVSLPLRFVFSETPIWQAFEAWVVNG